MSTHLYNIADSDFRAKPRQSTNYNWLLRLICEQRIPSESEIRRIHRQMIEKEKAELRRK